MGPVKELVVDSSKLKESVRAFRQLRDAELNNKEKKSILDEGERQESFVQLQLTVKKMSACQKIIMVPFTFPHCLLQEDDEVCFIVGCKEGDKGNKRADHDRYRKEWKDRLRQMGIEREIYVLPIMQLETEFKSFEAKRKLCKGFEHFMCDHRLMFRMAPLLGRLFFRRRKMPIRVYMKDEENFKGIIEEALQKTLIHITPEGPNVSIKVGNLRDHSDEQIVENIRAILDNFVPEQLPGGVDNLNSIHLASFLGKSVPVFVSLTSANDVDMTEVDKKFIEKQTPKELEDTIDTMPGVRVKVRSDGKVIAIKDDSEKLEKDDLLDEDYLDVFRDQEFEDRDEAKKRYLKHIARKGALRKVGKRFGTNMLKLPSHVPPPPPKPTKNSPGSKTALPKQQKEKPKPPAVPILDALQGYDEPESAGEECPELVPITPGKKAGQKSPKKAVETEFAVQLSPATNKKTKTGRKSTTSFIQDSVGKNKNSPAEKKNRKSDFNVETQTKKGVTPMKGKSAQFLTTPAKTDSVKKTKTSLARPEGYTDTPRPILKTPRDSKADRRKSVTFDFNSQDEGPIHTPQGTPGQKKRKSLPGGFQATPLANKKAKRSVK